MLLQTPPLIPIPKGKKKCVQREGTSIKQCLEEVRNLANYTDVPATRSDAILLHHIHHRNTVFNECSCIFPFCIHFGTGCGKFQTVCAEKISLLVWIEPKVKNIVTTICKNICSFFLHFSTDIFHPALSQPSHPSQCVIGQVERENKLSPVLIKKHPFPLMLPWLFVSS